MTLGHDDGLRVKRPSGISPLSIVRGGKDRPELVFLRSQVPPAEGMEPLAGLDACPGVRADWLAPEPPMSPGCVPRPSWAGTKQPPDCIGQTLGSTWRGGASRGYESLGNETTTARPVFQPLGLKEGVGFNPRVNFDGERKVSPSAGSWLPPA